jgi:hypothetical protein
MGRSPHHVPTPSARGAVALAAVPAAFAVGAAVAHVVLRAAPVRLGADLAQPLVVVTAWGAYGLGLFAVLAATVAVGAAGLFVALWPAWRRGGGPSVRATLTLSALALLAALAWPVVFSSDVYAYAAYGEALLHGHDPYVTVARSFHDAFVDAARWQWGGVSFPACVYGPVYVAFAALAVLLGGGKVGASLWILRVATCLAFLGSIALLNAALAGSPRRRLAVAAFGLNPVALWSAAEGHNDVLVLLTVFAAFAWLRRGRTALAGFTLGLGPLIKATGVLAGPVAFAYLWARRDARPLRFGVALILGCAVSAALLVPLQWKALAALSSNAHYAPQFSLQALLGVIPGIIIACAIGALGVRDLARGRFSGIVWLAIAGWLAIPNPYPWYALWILPVAVVAPPGRAAFALWAATISALLRYLPEAFGNIDHLQAAVLTLALLAPLVWSATQVNARPAQKVPPEA